MLLNTESLALLKDYLLGSPWSAKRVADTIVYLRKNLPNNGISDLCDQVNSCFNNWLLRPPYGISGFDSTGSQFNDQWFLFSLKTLYSLRTNGIPPPPTKQERFRKWIKDTFVPQDPLKKIFHALEERLSNNDAPSTKAYNQFLISVSTYDWASIHVGFNPSGDLRGIVQEDGIEGFAIQMCSGRDDYLRVWARKTRKDPFTKEFKTTVY